MTRYNFWKSLLKNQTNPCYVRDTETEEVLYVNDRLLQMFGFTEEIMGSCYREIIMADESVYEDIKLNWGMRSEYTFDFFHTKLKEYIRVCAVLSDDGKTVFGELYPCATLDHVLTFDDAMTQCIQKYNENSEEVVPSLMEILCEFYQSERAYVYRVNEIDMSIHCIAKCCHNPDYQVVEDVNKEMNCAVLIEWFRTKTKTGIVMANVEDEEFDLDSPLGGLFRLFQMKNFSVCTVHDTSGQMIGFVGLTNRGNYSQLFDSRLIKTVSHFVEQEINKKVLDDSLFVMHNRDSLTGLFNRIGYGKRIDEIMEKPPKTLGVVSVNINGLKEINSNLGMDAGDKHIKKSVDFIKSHFNFLFYRLSGDEFVGIAVDMEKNHFEKCVGDLIAMMKESGNYDFSLGYSWGEGKYTFSDLVQEADIRMYINKQEYYAVSNRTFENVSNAVLGDLLSYLEKDEFMIYLQPQLRLVDGSLYGAEALIRRFDKTNQKMVFPDQFIPLYEKNSVIRHIDLFVVEDVCKILAKWNQEGKAIPISVNLSRVTLQEHGIVDTITEICDKYEVPHHYLVIEVTERVGLIENKVASSLIMNFKEKGFNISLDDFGCAYSNIVTLAQIDVDEVKLDKSLVDDLTNNRKNHILVKNVLSMCKELEGMSTLAEGIEDLEQANLLHELGCHLGQGYFYSRPIPVDEFVTKYVS